MPLNTISLDARFNKYVKEFVKDFSYKLYLINSANSVLMFNMVCNFKPNIKLFKFNCHSLAKFYFQL